MISLLDYLLSIDDVDPIRELLEICRQLLSAKVIYDSRLWLDRRYKLNALRLKLFNLWEVLPLLTLLI